MFQIITVNLKYFELNHCIDRTLVIMLFYGVCSSISFTSNVESDTSLCLCAGEQLTLLWECRMLWRRVWVLLCSLWVVCLLFFSLNAGSGNLQHSPTGSSGQAAIERPQGILYLLPIATQEGILWDGFRLVILTKGVSSLKLHMLQNNLQPFSYALTH